MNSFLLLIAVGSLIPAITFISKKLVISEILERMKKEIKITDKAGKENKYFVDFNISIEEINKLYQQELELESRVRHSLNKYISQHKSMKLNISEGKDIDFLLSVGNKRIGIEAKFNAENFKASWLEDYFSSDSTVETLLLIFESKIPSLLVEKIKHGKCKNRVKFISSPRGKGLSESIENVLNNEIVQPKLNNALHRTSR